MNTGQHTGRRESGVALVIGLIFLLATTLIGIIALQNTGTSYQLSANLAYTEQAFQSSESGRSAIGTSVADYVWDRKWNTAALPSGLTVLDKDSADGPDSPTDENGATESLFDMDSLQKDMTYDWTDANNTHSLNSDVYLVKTQKILEAGAGIQQLSGYEGLGKAAAAGGGVIYFEIRSRGASDRGAEALTASEYRVKIQ